jgi:outer membrane autotransporter protein
LDKAYGKWLLGIAGGYARSDLAQDNNDTSDAQSGYGTLYASLGTVDWFGDLVLSFGRTRVESQSGTVLGEGADYDADNIAIYFGGGKEIQSSGNDGVVFTPEAALVASYYGQDSYTDGLMQVDAYDRWSVQSRLGAALAVQKPMGSAVLKPEFRTYWLHEFNADPDQIGYSLMGGAGRYGFGVQAPEEDILELGVGISSTFNDRLELALDFDAQFSDLYKALTVGGRIMYEF